MKSLPAELMDALVKLDRQLPGLGLYSASEYNRGFWHAHHFWKVEWELALEPCLSDLACLIEKPIEFPHTFGPPMEGVYKSIRFMTPSGKICDLKLVRISNTTITPFRVEDKSWTGKMAEKIRQLWWPTGENSQSDLRLLLFLGFDRINPPFHNEIADLDKAVRWADHQVDFISKCWKDRHRRPIRVFMGCWAYGSE